MKLSMHSVCKVLLSLMLMAGLAACNDNNSYSPGEEVPEGTVGAFFDKSNVTDYTIEGEGADSLVLLVNRVDASAEVTVPIRVLRCDTSLISIPASVHFAQGSYQDSLLIKIADGLILDHTYYYELAIDSAQISAYAAGSPIFSGTIFKGNPWKIVLDSVGFYFPNSTTCKLPTLYSDLYRYKNENRFYFENFMGSGNNQEFSLSGTFDAEHLENYEGSFAWDPDQVYHDSNGFDYIYSFEENSYSWSIEGSSVGISTFAGYMGAWSYISFKEKYLYFWCYCSTDDNVSTEAYFYGVWK